MKKRLRSTGLCILSFLLIALSGCTNNAFQPVEEHYDYSTLNVNYFEPTTVGGGEKKDALMCTTEDGSFFCFTSDTAIADDFINAQRTLLKLLRNYGVQIREMKYYGTDDQYSISESNDRSVYVALSAMRSWQQVLVTLQTVWGDYTDYGYVYAVSNTIAKELGWQVDSAPVIDKTVLDAFFVENPDAINLLYPTFSTKFSSEETVHNSKALATKIFQNLQWQNIINKPIQDQLDAYYALVSAYAHDLSVPFARQTYGYAYYGEHVKLRIMTTYAELIIDSNYHDTMESLYGDYWSVYSSIYATTKLIDEEITTAVKYFGLQNKAGIVKIKWLDSQNALTDQFITNSDGGYYPSTHVIYITSIRPYLHEYHHHIEYLITGKNAPAWQSQAFCEIGSSHSRYSQLTTENTFSKNELGIKLFHALTGRDYQPGRNDFFESWDILCYVNDYYELAYWTGAQAHNSFSRYLMDLYGEQTVCSLMLFPETVEEVTEKTWEELVSRWKEHIQNKYAGTKIPDLSQ